MAAVNRDGEWLTYDETASRLGITYGTARHRARKNGWATRTGGDGRIQTFVPSAELPIPDLREAGLLPPELAAFFERVATAFEESAAGLAVEAGRLRADGNEHAAQAGFSTGIAFGCVALVFRAALNPPAPVAEENADV
ncbi:hypothetical protein [Methylobacterium dankookense]|uniref:Uncharacterized protein n=1 Tax=Methylobacterium dankookense TaxID=560405 RepID=A0A564G5H1_9HYPH|nr:hypothetical protein [Methylobacterium dankookense]GJD55223.1 hypothetical protein IFDJLNFL_1107 [Methylobacterium dankookense]VUF15198.1 hypothetical protein MTDSW087_04933 [Methylobacterium dankookense]